MTKTKLTFKVWIGSEKRYISGWQDLQRYCMGVSNNRNDPEKINICFFDEPDSYFKIEHIKDSTEYISITDLFEIIDDMSHIQSYNGKNWDKICPERLKKKILELN